MYSIVEEINYEAIKHILGNVLNNGSMKIHYPSCKDVRKIKPDNYATSNLSLQDLQSQGYSTCGHCFK